MQRADLLTNLVCSIYDRLILNTFNAQNNLQAESGAIHGSPQGDIGVHHCLRADFFPALFRRNGLDRAQEAR